MMTSDFETETPVRSMLDEYEERWAAREARARAKRMGKTEALLFGVPLALAVIWLFAPMA